MSEKRNIEIIRDPPIRKYMWEDCTIGLVCDGCGEEIILDSQDPIQFCICGEWGLHINIDYGPSAGYDSNG